jgi:DNA-binding MarR family transcriptional regulator
MLRSNTQFDQSITLKLAQAAHALSGMVGGMLKRQFGLKLNEWAIAGQLLEQGPMQQAELVRLTGFDKVSISRGAETLVRRRLAKRTPYDGDGRSHNLGLTMEGEILAAQVSAAVTQQEAEILAQFDLGQISGIFGALQQIESRADAKKVRARTRAQERRAVTQGEKAA